MARRRAQRGVFKGPILSGHRSVQSFTSEGSQVSYRKAVPLANVQAVVDSFWDELDIIDPQTTDAPQVSYGVLRLIAALALVVPPLPG